MKTLNIVLICVLLSLSFTNAMAQFSGGAEVGLPMSTFSDLAKVGFGASVRYEASIQDKLSWTGSAGYLSFSGNDFTVGTVTGT